MGTNSENNEFNHEAGLKTIYQMIESAKANIGKNYFYYLFWGYLVVAACVIEYLLIAIVKYEYHFIVWLILMPLGSLFTLFFYARQRRSSRNKTYIGTFMGFLWSGWLVSFIILLVFANLKNDYGIIIPIALAMYGLAIFVSGGTVNFRPLLIGGVVAWITSIIAFFVPYVVQLAIMAAVVVVSYLIPGYMLRNQSNK